MGRKYWTGGDRGIVEPAGRYRDSDGLSEPATPVRVRIERIAAGQGA